MEAAERTEESADDMTAAETAPRPMNETHLGVKYWNTNGTTMFVCEAGMDAYLVPLSYGWYSVSLQSVFLAIAPIRAGGTAMSKQPTPAMKDNFCAPLDVLDDKTR